MGFCITAHAADGAGALVKFPAGPAAWTVRVEPTRLKEDGTPKAEKPTVSGTAKVTARATVSGTAARSKPEPERLGLVRVEVAQDERKRRHLLILGNGGRREIWELYYFNLAVAEDPRGTPTVSRSVYFFGPNFDQEAFAWLASARLQEKPAAPYQKNACLYYTGRREMHDLDGKVERVFPCAAWIDADTKLPVALDDGEYFVTYEFRPATAETLTLPPKLKRKLERSLRLSGFGTVEGL
ncbi:MAG: hypothetical protein LBK60_00700 [Verrucomicrobiales bacterium]|nr:hypothetical protein [Verrucomicrobiales bacterium]